jgi:hypothetical protein
MTNENTCNAINAWFDNCWFILGYGKCQPCNFFAYSNVSFDDSTQFDFLKKDEGSFQCQNEPFSDFAV